MGMFEVYGVTRTGKTLLRMGTILGLMGSLAACEDGQGFDFLKPKEGTATAADASSGADRSTKLVERDVEAPDVFQATEAGLWDGRPSLGGVWVAHPDVKDPERVIIRNPTNNKFVIGALFRKERETPGPRLQVSSDAAAALGMLAGQPANLNVTALRRETVNEAPAIAAPAGNLDAPADVAEAELDPVTNAAAAAIATADATPTTAPAPTPAPKPASSSSLTKPYIQIGIFSIEKNAQNTATSMRQAGIVPTVKKQSSSGKTFWRVIVGPAQNSTERASLLKKIKSAGFSDAYAVTN